jgi:hypothetical protein
LETVDAPVTINDLDMLQQVIAEHSTRITDDVLSDSVRLAIDAINGVILDANEEGKEPPVFSFVDCIKKKGHEALKTITKGMTWLLQPCTLPF